MMPFPKLHKQLLACQLLQYEHTATETWDSTVTESSTVGRGKMHYSAAQQHWRRH